MGCYSTQSVATAAILFLAKEKIYAATKKVSQVSISRATFYTDVPSFLLSGRLEGRCRSLNESFQLKLSHLFSSVEVMNHLSSVPLHQLNDTTVR